MILPLLPPSSDFTVPSLPIQLLPKALGDFAIRQLSPDDDGTPRRPNRLRRLFHRAMALTSFIRYGGRNAIPLFVLLFLAFPEVSRAASERPNILWVVTEDNSVDYVGAYGDPLARTPVFDRLAAEGVVFDRAYANAPVCAAARSCLITGRYATSLGSQHMRSRVPMPPDLRFFPAYLRDAGYFTTNNDKTDYNTAVLPDTWDENGKTAHWRNRPEGQPFFSVFNYRASHESSLHKRLPLTTDPAKVRVPAYLPDKPEVRADIAQYFDRVAEADRQIGELLAELEADGLTDDTIIFYYSDHGGVLPRSKRFLYENGVHVPLVLRVPEKFRALAPGAPGSRSPELVSFVDFAPTVLSLARAPIPKSFQGRAFAGPYRTPAPAYAYQFRDRMDERYDLSRAVTNGRWRYIRNYRPDVPNLVHLSYLWRMASMQVWDRLHREGKLNPIQESFFHPKPAEQLFDCEADPDNVHNLAGDPAHHDTLEALRAANRAHLLAIRDTGFMPETMMRRLAGEHSPTTIARDKARYPLARLLDLIDAAQLGTGLPSSDVCNEAQSDALPLVRYWAALCSLASPQGTAPNELLEDPDPSVRLAAAYATATRHPAEDLPWQVLAAGLDPSHPLTLRLEAINYLTLLPKLPQWLAPTIESAAQPGPHKADYVNRAASYLAKETSPDPNLKID